MPLSNCNNFAKMAAQKPNEAELQPQAVMIENTISNNDIRDGDEALDFLRKEEVGDELQYVDEKKLLHKIDFMVMPLMFFCYLLQYLDKSLCEFRPRVRSSSTDETRSSELCLRDGPPRRHRHQHEPVCQFIAVVLCGVPDF